MWKGTGCGMIMSSFFKKNVNKPIKTNKRFLCKKTQDSAGREEWGLKKEGD